MLEIKIIMDSSVEDVLAFKTCCGLKAFDQNLEIHVINKGARPITIHSYFDLEGPGFFARVDNLMPQGPQRIMAGEIKGFYCFMDKEVWKKAATLTFYDLKENRHERKI